MIAAVDELGTFDHTREARKSLLAVLHALQVTDLRGLLYRRSSHPTPAPARNGTPIEDDGGGRSTIRRHGFETGEFRQQKLSLHDLYPPRRTRNVTPTKGRWGGVNGSSPMDLDGAEKTPIRKSEKFSLQDLYPPGR
jgi:hypothetical protein